MKHWEEAMNQFLVPWLKDEKVIGVLVCGSYITGTPSERSDIDVHIIINDECDWRERGNKYVDGFLIEYFVNPPKQIRKYFEENYEDQSTMSMVQFLTGKVIFDKYGIVDQLKQEARNWKNEEYKELSQTIKELKKYHIWDSYDNLLNCYEQNRNDFNFVYYNSICNLFSEYCKLFKLEKVPYYQIYSYLTDPNYLTKYLKTAFPDETSSNLFLRGILSIDIEEMLNIYKALTEHILNKLGGFNIDGWEIRTGLS